MPIFPVMRKHFNESLYRAMVMGCEAFPTDDTVEAICKYIMKGNPRKTEYFRWFSAAVDQRNPDHASL